MKRPEAKSRPVEHNISLRCEPPSRRGALHLMGGHRAHCSCGWSSDCYSQLSDTERAVKVHLQRAQGREFNDLLARSSIGAALLDIKERGIEAHLADLERELPNRHKKPATVKKPDRLAASDRSFMRGFGVALASIWNCHHDADMVRSILKENGFTPESFRGVGLEEADLAAIRRAVQ